MNDIKAMVWQAIIKQKQARVGTDALPADEQLYLQRYRPTPTEPPTAKGDDRQA